MNNRTFSITTLIALALFFFAATVILDKPATPAPTCTNAIACPDSLMLSKLTW